MVRHAPNIVKTLLIVVFCLSVASDVEARTFQYVGGVSGTTYLEMDTTYFDPEPTGSYVVEYGYGTTSAVEAWTPVGNSCTGAGCDPNDPYNFTKVATTTPYYWTAIHLYATDVTYYTLWDVGQNGEWKPASMSETGYFPCTTCTRIISQSPTGTIASSTFQPIDVSYYVSEDDFWEGYTYIEYRYSRMFGDVREPQETFTDTVFQAGENEMSAIASNFDETGTYSIVITIYTDPWYWFREDKHMTNINVHVNASSTLEEIWNTSALDQMMNEVYGNITCSFSLTLFNLEAFDCLLDYVWASIVPPQDALSALVQGELNDLLTRAPIGYGTRLVQIFNATSTGSSSLAITHTIPNGMPGAGLSLSLNTGQDLRNAVNDIDTMSVATIQGSPMDKFLFYWNTLWWVLFAFWLLQKVYGQFNLNLNDRKEREYKTQV